MVDGLKGKAKLAYTAGILDGEGCIRIKVKRRKGRNPSHYISVQIGNTNEWLINWLKFNYGGCISSYQRQGSTKWKKCWYWQLDGFKARDFLVLILPYLNLKRPQAEIAIQFQLGRNPSGKRLTDKQLALNEAQKILISSYNQGRNNG